MHLARADAVQAAHAAANASAGTKWITLSSYGAGAHAKIQPGGAIKFGIRFGHESTPFTGGWKISGVDVDSVQDACIDAEIVGSHPELRKAAGLWINNVKLTNAAGMTVNTTFPGAESVPQGYVPIWAAGIAVTHVDYVQVTGTEIANVDIPFAQFAGQGLWITGANWHDSFREGVEIAGIQTDGGSVTGSTACTPAKNFLFESSTVSNSGSTTGWSKGQAAVQFSNARDGIVRSNTFSSTHVNTADGVGIDFEGFSAADIDLGTTIPARMLIVGNTVSSNVGAGILTNQSTTFDSTSEMLIDNNAFTSNGNNGLPAIMGMRTGVANTNFIFTRNNTARVVTGQQKWGGAASTVYSPLTNITPSGYVYGLSNTDHFP